MAYLGGPVHQGRPAWEQRSGEGSRAFAAFVRYRDQQPAARSIRAVARELHRSVSLLGRWSSRWQWSHRASAWDEEVDRRLRAQFIREARDARRRQLDAGRDVLSFALARLRSMAAEDVGPAQIIRMLQVGAAIEREALLIQADAIEVAPTTSMAGEPDETEELGLMELLARNPSHVGPFVTMMAEMRDAARRVPDSPEAYPADHRHR